MDYLISSEVTAMRRRPFRRPFPSRPPRRIPPALRQANTLMAAGRYAEAAQRFEKLTQGAEERHIPHAAALAQRTARAYFLAGETEKGLQWAKHGLDILARRQQWEALHRAGRRASAALRQHGDEASAQAIEAHLQSLLPADFTPPRAQVQTGVLPTHCPGCGAPVHPQEVEWLDSRTAACPYCGTPLRAE